MPLVTILSLSHAIVNVGTAAIIIIHILCTPFALVPLISSSNLGPTKVYNIHILDKTASCPRLRRCQLTGALLAVCLCLANPSALRMLYHHLLNPFCLHTIYSYQWSPTGRGVRLGFFPFSILSGLSLSNHAHAICQRFHPGSNGISFRFYSTENRNKL